MTAAKTFVMSHPVVTYFVLTFLISWGGIVVVLGPGAFTGATAPIEGLLPLVYLVALLTAPLVVTAVLLPLSLSSAGFLPGLFASDDQLSLVVIGLAAGLMTGLCEELGWTGFVISRLRQRYGVLSTGLIVGLLWGAWHFPVLAGAMWIVVAAVAFASSGLLSRRPIQGRMA